MFDNLVLKLKLEKKNNMRLRFELIKNAKDI